MSPLDDSPIDAIVVGGGVAGCVVASERHARGQRVLIVEAGSPTAHAPTPPIDIASAVIGRTIPGLQARRTPAQGLTPYLAGWGLGGGSLINGLIYDDPAGSASIDLLGTPLGRGMRRLVTNDCRVTFADLVSDVPVVHSQVMRVVRGARRAGVELADGEVRSAREVLLCAGALVTPRLLASSGFEHPALGRGLRDHPGLLLDCPGHGLPPVQRTGETGVVSAHGDTIAVVLLATNTSGWLENDQAELRLLDDPRDLAAMRHLIRSVLGRCPAASGPDGTTAADLLAALDADLDNWLLRNEGGVYHACGTAAQGRVTDESGRLPGWPQVRVADASGLPALPATLLMSAVVHHARTVAQHA